MDILSILSLLGGIGMFLYGMSYLGKSLEKLAGASLERILSKLTGNRFKALALGTGVTCVIQSSAATSVMAIGFLNAGLFKLSQCVPVIMGANIGTTITGQILRLGDISSTNILLLLLKPSSFAPLLIFIGAAIMLVSKRDRTNSIASIIIGFGILFFGLTTMENALTPLRESVLFQQMMTTFSSPLLGILIGIIVTSIIQSSSASVGILQALSSTGTITWGTAIPIVLGMNIGKVFTVLIASIGTNRECKRAVLIDVINNIIGVAICLVIYCVAQIFGGFSFWEDVVNRGNIADFHTLFNLCTVAVIFPFTGRLIDLSGKLVRNSPATKQEQDLALLDELFLKTPPVALGRCKTVINTMADTTRENFTAACNLLGVYDEKNREEIAKNESFIDKCETALGEYVIKIMANDLDNESHRHATELIYSIGDFERIGDYAENIADVAQYDAANGLKFSEEALGELYYISEAISDIIKLTVEAHATEDPAIARQVEPLEEVVDELVELIRDRHYARISQGRCDMQRSTSFTELLTNFERISDHCSNIAVHLLQRLSPSDNFDAHKYLDEIHLGNDQEYKQAYDTFWDRYCLPLKD